MTSVISSLKRLYEAAALVAVLNVLGLIGMGAYFAVSGVVNSQRLQQMAAILRGQELVPADAPVESPVATVSGQDQPEDAAPKTLAELQTDAELLRLEEERIKAELDQRLALNNSILLRVMAQREQFQREQEDADRKQRQAKKQRQTTGFQKQVEIYEALSPKVALDHLLGMTNPDDAAKILMDMDTRTAKKIIEAGKKGKDLEQMKRILSRLRDVAPAKSDELQGS